MDLWHNSLYETHRFYDWLFGVSIAPSYLISGLLPTWMEFLVFALHFILDPSGKGVILTVQKTSLCLQLYLWGLSQQIEALGKTGKAAGNGHQRVLDIGNICTGQCLCSAVIPRMLSCYRYTPTMKHSTYPWPDMLHTMCSLWHSCLFHWTVNLDENQLVAKCKVKYWCPSASCSHSVPEQS